MTKAAKAADKPVKPKKTKAEKKKQRLRIFYGAIFFVSLIIWWGLQPIEGPIQLGICRTFVELELRFPNTLVISSVEEFERTMRLYYTYLGSSGEQRSSMIECKFATNPTTGLYLESVQIDRVPIDKKKVDAFSRLIPIVIAAEPDLETPGELEDKDLVDLKTEYQYHDWEQHQ